MSLSKWPPGSHIGFLGFQTLTLIWLWISTPNFSGIILMYMGKSLLIFSDINFWKWPPCSHIGFFGFRTLTVVWLWISTPNFSGTVLMYMGRSLLIFSGVNFKMVAWQPYWNFWFPDSYFCLALNMNSKLNGSILVHMSRSLLIFSYLIF